MANMFSKKIIKEFISWYRLPTEKTIVKHQTTQYTPSQSNVFESFIKGMESSIDKDDIVDIIIHHQLPQGDFSLTCADKYRCNINNFTLYCQGSNTTKLLLTGLRINNLNIDYNNIANLTIENCDIKRLSLGNQCKVTLKNCHIGQINFNNVSFLHVEKGFILDFICPVPGSSNPFSGSISLNGTFIPRDTKNYLLTGPQPYRNIRHHLKSIENGQLANFFHSAELAVERENDTVFNKIISHAYESFSDFGASALRPIIWWFTIGFASALLIYYFDGAVNAFSLDSDHYTGWRDILICSNGYRSVYLSFQSMLNPLGILGIKSLVIPASGWLVTYLLFQGLLSAILIALMIFAIRRRFKISN
ncbi:MAG: hypothetical protein OQK73_08855 [Gammaproteobacteria bacterium]|nr:hypothetical protein [Gammaproteobacteria bacterium]